MLVLFLLWSYFGFVTTLTNLFYFKYFKCVVHSCYSDWFKTLKYRSSNILKNYWLIKRNSDFNVFFWKSLLNIFNKLQTSFMTFKYFTFTFKLSFLFYLNEILLSDDLVWFSSNDRNIVSKIKFKILNWLFSLSLNRELLLWSIK